MTNLVFFSFLGKHSLSEKAKFSCEPTHNEDDQKSGFSDSAGQTGYRAGHPEQEDTSACPLSAILSLSHSFPHWRTAVLF